MAFINSCLGALAVPTDGVITGITIDFNSIDLSAETVAIALPTTAGSVFAASYAITIIGGSTTANVDKVSTLILDGITATATIVNAVTVTMNGTGSPTPANIDSLEALVAAITTGYTVVSVTGFAAAPCAASITDAAS